MKDPLKVGFEPRLQAAAEAKKALLAKLKPKAASADPDFAGRAAERASALEAVRIQRADEKAAAKAAAAQAIADREAAELADKRGDRKERKALSKAEAKAQRDAKYAARKARR